MSQAWALVQNMPFKRYYQLRNNEVLLGSGQECDIRILRTTRVHARIIKMKGKAHITSDEDGHIIHKDVPIAKGTLSELRAHDQFTIVKTNGHHKKFIFTTGTEEYIQKKQQQLIQQTQKYPHEPCVNYEMSSIKMNNKLIIRAAMIGDATLLNQIMFKQYNVSSLFETWGPDNRISAIEFCFIRRDDQFLESLMQYLKSYKFGYYDTFLHSDEEQKQIRQGQIKLFNEAFKDDIKEEEPWNFTMLQRLASVQTNPALYDLLPQDISILETSFVWAIRSGNIKTASYLCHHLLELNQQLKLHNQILSEINPTKIKYWDLLDEKLGSYKLQPVHCACIHPSSRFLEEILIKYPQQSQCLDEIDRSPVHYAAASQTPSTLELLRKFKVNLKAQDQKMNTPLMIAAQYGRVHNIQQLPYDNINDYNQDGDAAIHLAAMGGHLEVVKHLADHGANINSLNKQGMSPIQLASAHDHIDLVKYLNYNQNYDRRDIYGRTSIILASRNGNYKSLSYLIMKKANIKLTDYSGNSALHYATAYGFTECVDILLKQDVNINSVNNCQLTALQLSIQKGLYTITRQLIDHNADLKSTDHQGYTIPMLLLQNLNPHSFDILNLLIIEKQMDVTIVDSKGRSLLHQISDTNNRILNSSIDEQKQMKLQLCQLKFNLIDILISQGADINLIDNQGMSPYFYAISQSNLVVAQKLQKYSPERKLVTKLNKNILHILIESDIFYTFKGVNLILEILSQKLEINYDQIDNQGFTPLLRLIYTYTKNRQRIDEILMNKCLYRIYKKKISLNNEVTVQKTQFIQKESQIINIIQQESLIQKSFEHHLQKITVEILESEFTKQQDKVNRQLKEFQDLVLQIYHKLVEKGANKNAHVIQVYEDIALSMDGLKRVTHFVGEYYPNLQFLHQLNVDQLTNKDCHGRTPMHLFAEQCSERIDHIQFFRELVCNTDLNDPDNLHKTVTHILAVRGVPSLLEIAIEKGGKVNTLSTYNVIPLTYWVKQNDLENVSLLIKYADVNFKDNDGRTALHFAVNNSDLGPFTIQKTLLEQGADITAIDNFGRTPMFYAFYKIQRESQTHYIDPFYEVTRYLHIKQITITDCLGRSLLHYAAYRGSLQCARHFISFGCSTQLSDNYGNTPLAMAFLGGHEEICNLLMQSQYDVNGHTVVLEKGKLNKYSFFRLALRNKLYDIALELINKKIDLKMAYTDAKEEKCTKMAQDINSFRLAEMAYINAHQSIVNSLYQAKLNRHNDTI